MEKNNNETIILDEKGMVIKDNNELAINPNLERVDFSEPSSIISFGDATKESITSILENTAQISGRDEELVVSEKDLKMISNFDEQLDDSENKRNKKELVLITKIKDILTSMGVKKFEEDKEANSYSGKFKTYCEGISHICEIVESQKQAALADIELRKTIINEMNPYIDELEEMVRVGKMDLEAYKEEIESLKQLDQTQDVIYEIQNKTIMLEVFNKKLAELEKAVVLYKEQRQSYQLQQKTDMELVMQHDSYIRDQAPILKAQGSVMVFNRQEKMRIETAQKLNEATNIAIQKNAQDLEQNVASIVELSINGGITKDTIDSLKKSIANGVKTFKDGRVKIQARINSDRKALEEINASLSEYQKELNDLIETSDELKEAAKRRSAKKLTK